MRYWRKELGEEIRLNTKLEKRLNKPAENSDDVSTMLAINPAEILCSKEYSSVPQEHPLTVSEEMLCSICENSIIDYVPTYFHGKQFNPACDKCDPGETSDDYFSTDPTSFEPEPLTDPNQPFTPRGLKKCPRTSSAPLSTSTSRCSDAQRCIIRQPFPPPIPSLTPLVNEQSMYNEKIVAGELDWGSTCWYCMRIEYEKYGCDS